jgi:hypothetical protein
MLSVRSAEPDVGTTHDRWCHALDPEDGARRPSGTGAGGGGDGPKLGLLAPTHARARRVDRWANLRCWTLIQRWKDARPIKDGIRGQVPPKLISSRDCWNRFQLEQGHIQAELRGLQGQDEATSQVIGPLAQK